MEIIIGTDRRRRWRLEEKLWIVAETEQLGASFAAVLRMASLEMPPEWACCLT